MSKYSEDCTGECNWIYIVDWMGDPCIPNGTVDCSYYYCQTCGSEQTEKPDGYEEQFEEPIYDD